MTNALALRMLFYLQLSPMHPWAAQQTRVQTHLGTAVVLTESTDERQQVSSVLHARQNALERAQAIPAQQHRDVVITTAAPLCLPEVKIKSNTALSNQGAFQMGHHYMSSIITLPCY